MLISRFVKKLKALSQLDADDMALLERLEVHPHKFGRGEDIISDGDDPDHVMLIQSGLACRYTLLPDGNRQITAYLLAGDFCDLHVFILRKMDHSIGVLSPASVVGFPKTAIDEMLARPRIARALLKATLIDEATLRQWIVNVAARPADVAIAHLFCEMHLRMMLVGLVDGPNFSLPVTQDELADTVGLSSVHVNRSLQHLRSKNLLEFMRGEAVIPDVVALQKFAGFDPGYLHLGH